MPPRIAIAQRGKRCDPDRQYRLQSDYLKFYRIIRYYICRKYQINEVELELMLFLRGEKYFTKKHAEQWKDVLGWDKERFGKMLQNGWIEVYRKAKIGRWCAIYHLPYKAQRMLTSLYDLIEMRKVASVGRSSDSVMYKKRKTDVPFADAAYAREIKKMNDYIRAQNKARLPKGWHENSGRLQGSTGKGKVILRPPRHAPE